jgi:cell division protein ZapE
MSDSGTLHDAYHESLRRHGYEPDAAQEHAVARLEDLRRRLEATHSGRRSLLRRLRRARQAEAGAVRGLYLWGGVGRGKTFLMDLFHAGLPVPSRRRHFHRFMKDVHGRLRSLRDVERPLDLVAAEFAGDLRVLWA